MEISVLIVLEMLLANLFISGQCSTRRFPLWATLPALLLLLGLPLLPPLRPWCSLLLLHPLALLFLAVYLLPLQFLYLSPLKRMVSTFFTTWLYTTWLALFSQQLALLFGQPIDGLACFVIQTVLHLVCLYPFYRLITRYFGFILNHLPRQLELYLALLSVLWYLILVLVAESFLGGVAVPLHLGILLALALCALMTYGFIYMVVNGSKTIRKLKKIAYTDPLTQVRSRFALFMDMGNLIKEGSHFELVYIDLNSFKTINDRFGHQTGDRYLHTFAHIMEQRIGKKGIFYRIAGDEFACLCVFGSHEALKKNLSQPLGWPMMNHTPPVPFLGFSFGLASYPENGTTPDELMQAADGRMYEMKKIAHSALKNEENGL